jgi:uncharacterized protein
LGEVFEYVEKYCFLYVFYYNEVSVRKISFEWDQEKDALNQKKHGVSFSEAQEAFFDPSRVIAEDIEHSSEAEKRYYCFAKVGEGILTVRFTYRKNRIRIIGAGYWRKGKKVYEEKH